jgi:hypothetical protein
MKGHGRKLAWLLALLALAGTATLLQAADKAAPQHPSLAGTWTLNEDLTARMRENDQQSAPHNGSGGGFGRRGGGGGRRGGGGYPGGPQSGGTAGSGGESRESGATEGQHPNFAAFDTLTITQSGNQVTITDKEGRAHVYRADGGKVHDDKALGGPAEVQARWDQESGGLVVEVKPDKGPKRTESYIVSDDGKHLYMVLTVEGERGSRKIRRAYDPAAAEEKPAPPADPEETEVA